MLAPPAAPLGLQLAVGAAAWKALQRCWAADVFVPQLADRFLRLALQVSNTKSSTQ